MPIADFPFGDAIRKVDFIRCLLCCNVLKFNNLSSDRFCLEIPAHFLLLDDVSKNESARAATGDDLCTVFGPSNTVNRSDGRRAEFRIAVRPLRVKLRLAEFQVTRAIVRTPVK